MPFSSQGKDQFLFPLSPNRLPEDKNCKRQEIALFRQKRTLKNNMGPCHGLLINGCGGEGEGGTMYDFADTSTNGAFIHERDTPEMESVCRARKGMNSILDALSLRSLW